MFYPLGKKTQKNRMGGGIHRRLCVRGLSYTQHIFLLKAKRKRKISKKKFLTGQKPGKQFCNVTCHMIIFGLLKSVFLSQKTKI